MESSSSETPSKNKGKGGIELKIKKDTLLVKQLDVLEEQAQLKSAMVISEMRASGTREEGLGTEQALSGTSI